MSTLQSLAEPYSTILCDIWGVIHDGGRMLPGAARRLTEWKDAGKTIILVTNAPRPASSVQAGLDALGLPRATYDAITSSGEAGIAALIDPARAVGFLGTREDRDDLVAHGVQIVDDDVAQVACTGLDEQRALPEEYAGQLRDWADRDVLFHCLNPDREVIHRGQREACAGALADLYEAFGGRVAWYGKPHAPIYAHALSLAGNPLPGDVLAIGDGPVTDMLGAARFGLDAIFISHGVHAGAPFPPEFAARYGLGDWRPIATFADLG
ncbi:MAG: TIGR01459 family HAD-type hydrolase [Pseudomonadota bacterium]|nr:TIGR01459 family HAD-type hydrolase [Pseudomonadota bacterium]